MMEFIYDFFGTINNHIRYTGKLCHLNTITTVCSALYNLTEEYDVVTFFFYSNAIIIDIVHLVFQLG